DPHHPHAFDSLSFAQLAVCNWQEVARLAQPAEDALRGNGAPPSLTYPLYYFGNQAYQLTAARAYLQANCPPVRAPLPACTAVDLNGLTRGWRPGVLAHRPAPVQVLYLGYPGTTGAGFIDYVLADATVLPLDQQPIFAETIVHLPDCYHPNDTTRSLSAVPDRAELGLPAGAFVFCCFNQSHKISAASF